MTTYTAAGSATWGNERPNTWFVVDLPLTANLVLHDTFIFMSSNNFGYRIIDWFIDMPQVDTNGAPTVLIDIGFINQAGNALESGFEWEQNLAIGRTAAGNWVKPTLRNHHSVTKGRGRRIGLHVAAAPATPVFSGRTITVGLLLGAI